MSYQIIGDSCMDRTPEMYRDSLHFKTVPLSIEVGGQIIVDDDSFDQAAFLTMMKESPLCPKSACPSPEAFLRAYEESPAKDLYVLTISEKLSGSCNAARLGRELYLEAHGDSEKNIAVFSTDTATAGQTLLALMCRDLCEKGFDFQEVCSRMEDHIRKMKIFFVLEDLSALRKNGRLSGAAAFFANALNIKPVLCAEHGEILKFDQVRGIDRALRRMCRGLVENASASGALLPSDLPSERIRALHAGFRQRAVITHCNCPKRAEQVRQELLSLAVFDEVLIAPTHGISTLYASDGGVVAAI